MPVPKNQHFVPRFYLKQFADENDQLWVFDKFSRKIFPSNVKNVASETYFYDFGPAPLRSFEEYVRAHPEVSFDEEVLSAAREPQLVERELSAMEAYFAEVLHEVITTIESQGRITEGQKALMAYFVSMQMVRTPEFRRTLIELQTKLVNEIGERFFGFTEDSITAAFDERYAAVEHARLMFSPKFVGALTESLRGHIWRIGINGTEQAFYTSDSPVIKRSHLHHDAYGIGSPGVEVDFPLTPKYILCMYEKNAFADHAESDCMAMPVNADNVLYFNSGQALQSYRHVYSRVNDFAVVERACREHPDICRPRVNRVTIVRPELRPTATREALAQKRQDRRPRTRVGGITFSRRAIKNAIRKRKNHSPSGA